MAIDTREKRQAAAWVSGVGPPSVTPNALKDQEWRQESGWGYSGIAAAAPAAAPPADDDTDTAIGTYTDCHSYELRPARLTALHSMNSGRNAALIGPDRMALDMYEVRSIRTGRLPTEGIYVDIFLGSSRAGERWAPEAVDVTFVAQPHVRRIPAAETTVRTNCDGYEAIPPTWLAYLSMDGARNAQLETVGATDQDAYAVFLDLPTNARGMYPDLMLSTTGRAGERGVPHSVVVEYVLSDDLPNVAAAVT